MFVAAVVLMAVHVAHCTNISDNISATNYETRNLTAEDITMMMPTQTKSIKVSVQNSTMDVSSNEIRRVIRLASNRINAVEGRVEVFTMGIWGTVCDDGFNDNAALVVCRMLGYEIQYPMVFHGAYYGEGSGRIWFDDVKCIGTESDIFSCSHNGLGEHNCGHSEDVGVNCLPNTRDFLRLVHPLNKSQGRVELYRNGIWGTVCDVNFDVNAARVICRTLGFESEQPIVFPGAYYGQGVGEMVANDVRCTGSEPNILRCAINKNVSIQNCGHDHDVGVNCQPLDRDFVRLAYPRRNSSKGRVEVYRNEGWGTVCDDGFEVTEARVICRMLGFTIEEPVIHSGAYYGTGRGIIHMANDSCNGTESSLFDCGQGDLRSRNCSHSQDVGINCQPASPSPSVRLMDGMYPWEGRVEVWHNGTWYSICDNEFDDSETRVICSMLGYNSEEPVINTGAYYGAGSGIIHMANDSCNGTESSLFDCGHGDPRSSNCSHSQDVGINCQPASPSPPVRLMDGVHPWEGRVEVWHNGTWHSVCDNEFDDSEARVICSMLEYSRYSPAVFGNAYYGQATGEIWPSKLQCNGREPSIFQCQQSGLDENYCRHNKDVGINCYPSNFTEQ